MATLEEQFKEQADTCKAECDAYKLLPVKDQDPKVLAQFMANCKSAELCLKYPNGIPQEAL